MKITDYSTDGGKADVTGNPLDKREQPAREDYSAGGGKAGVTGNLCEQPAGEDGGKADVTGNSKPVASR